MKPIKKSIFLPLVIVSFVANSQDNVKLDDRCVVNVLNRTIQVSKDGGWALPNVPSNMGRVRARATCTLDNDRTVSGQSDYFSLATNQITNIKSIKLE